MDVRIIGGGPAGSAAAIRLARRGHRVSLFEKATFPRAKLCGGFISAEAFPELVELGVAEAFIKAGAWPIHRLTISAASGFQTEVSLPGTAYGISRRTLDALLLDRARADGATIHHADGFHDPSSADWTVIATGRPGPMKHQKPLLPSEGWEKAGMRAPLRRNTALTPTLSRSQRGRGRNCFYAIQSTFSEVRRITDEVELNLFPGGYVGLNRHEDGNVNLCALLDPALLRRYGPDLDAVLRALRDRHAGLANRLNKARRLQPWLAVGPVEMGLRSLSEEKTFFIGDAACVVDPFAGEGLTMALLTAHLMSDALLQHPSEARLLYERQWHQSFDHPVRIQSLLRRLTRSPLLQEGLVRGSHLFPSLLEWLTIKTRATLQTAV